MFSSSANYNKLKTNLRLVINRLKLLEKKKTELAAKARKEIADYISGAKDDRARIRVEHIVREDYLVEAMELLEMYCDLLLARFGLIQTQKELDPGLEEPIATLIWATPRLQADVPELKIVADQLSAKYGKEFAQSCRTNELNNVNEKVMHKLGVQAPPKILIERYMIEIAKTYNVPFEPDPSVMAQDEIFAAENLLIDLDEKKGGGGSGGGGGGGMSVPQIQPSASAPYPPRAPQDPAYPPPPGGGYPPQQQNQPGGFPPPVPQSGPIGPGGFVDPGAVPPKPSYDDWLGEDPKKQVHSAPSGPPPNVGFNLPDLPTVPNNTLPDPGNSVGTSSAGGEDIDFDDLTKRFEKLKKKK
ncbi:IST1 homolog isoform X1 [Mytilus edulis]|uniref:IST1 homolog n=1 Tax=Mytilus edulis TaxID=6550 RepID=A0A8S3USD8_MYTED|nr:IST1 [Mytilus edulis]